MYCRCNIPVVRWVNRNQLKRDHYRNFMSTSPPNIYMLFRTYAVCIWIYTGQNRGTQKWMVDSFWTMDDNGQIVFVVHTHTIFHHLLSSNKNSPFFLSKFGHFKGLSRTFNSVTNGKILAKPSANPGLQQDDVKDLRNHNMGKKATSKYGLRNLNQLIDRFPYYGLS